MSDRKFIRISWWDIENPFKAAKEANVNVIKYENFGIADCTIMEVDNIPDPLPKHWDIVSGEFKFSNER